MQRLFAIAVGLTLAATAIAPAAARDRTTTVPPAIVAPQHAGQGGNGTASASAVDNTPSIGATNGGPTTVAAPPSVPHGGAPAGLPPGATTTSNGNANVPPSINVPPDTPVVVSNANGPNIGDAAPVDTSSGSAPTTSDAAPVDNSGAAPTDSGSGAAAPADTSTNSGDGSGNAAPVASCSDFASWYDAQNAYEAAGGTNADPALVNSLDPDWDGIACENMMDS